MGNLALARDIIGLIFTIMGGAPGLIENLKQVVEFLKWASDQWHVGEASFPSRSVVKQGHLKTQGQEKMTQMKKLAFDAAAEKKIEEVFKVTATPLQLERLRTLVDKRENPKWKAREFRGGKKP